MASLRLTFAAAVLMACLELGAIALAAPPAGASTPSPNYNFVSAPNLHPPRLQVLKRQPTVPQGDFLATTQCCYSYGAGPIVGPVGPLILDSHARPVWFLPSSEQALNLEQQTYNGRPVLLWFYQPSDLEVVNEHYRTIATVQAQSPWLPDEHDAWISGGDIWITVSRTVPDQNLTAYGGPSDGSVLDFGLQEFLLSTGQLIRTWDALNPGGKPNVPLSESEVPATRGWDAYHMNSVQALPNGNLLVSMRNTSAVYLIHPATGKVLWTLGGKRSSFILGPGAGFAFQHDARLVHPGQGGWGQDVKITLFNDNNGSPSEGMTLSVDTAAHQATLVSAFPHSPSLFAGLLGSMQLLPNGDALVGWGSEPFFSEYSPSGGTLLDVRWPEGDRSYRVLYTDSWVGAPYYPPSGAVQGSTVYASWNGATQVAKWEVLAGSSSSDLKVVDTHARAGFETAIKLGTTYSVYKVRALNDKGRTLGTSKPFS